LAVIEGCKHALELSIPVEEVEAELNRVTADVQKKARLPGFRPGKAPASLIRKQFQDDIRQQVLEALIPKYLNARFTEENLNVAGQPDISEVHFHAGEPLRFKAEFEVVPQVELQDYSELSVPYEQPSVSDEDVTARIDEIRVQKADYANIDPRPIEDGDFAVLSLESLSGMAGEAVKRDEMMLQIGGSDTLEGFTQNLRGLSPGEEKEFDVAYPEDYGSPKLAGKTVKFRAKVKGVRRKELPEINDEFAQDLGDYRTVEELREAVRRALAAEREHAAQQEAKNKLVESMVDAHDFPVPEVFVERQIRNRIEQTLRAAAQEGTDLSSLKLDWEKIRDSQREKATREVKASLLLSRVAEREAIHATAGEVDREVERLAKSQREPFAAVRLRMEKEGALGKIASHIQTEKTLTFLFERARKVAEG
jgi:trigger factor